MLNDLDLRSKEIGLSMNLTKTKLMFNGVRVVQIENKIAEKVETCIYLVYDIRSPQEGKTNINKEDKKTYNTIVDCFWKTQSHNE